MSDNYFKKNKIAVGVSMALAYSVGVQAQEQAEQQVQQQGAELEELVVIGGYRASLLDAINTKRNAESIVEAISAEDIGQLPDSSIAESLARISGLAGERRGGRTSGISVRGFREDFVGTTMNGRELLGIGDNRGVEYDLYPSEIITGAVVYKASDASLGVQGIGGTVDLKTARPLDVDRTLTVNTSFEKNDAGSPNPDFDDTGHRIALSYIEQFADDTVGLALAVSTTESPLNSREREVWGYSTDANGLQSPDGFRVWSRSKALERDTISAALQFRPTDTLDITVDALDIDFADSGLRRGFDQALGIDLSQSSTNNGIAYTSGTSVPFAATNSNRTIEKDGELQQVGVNVKWQATDNLEVKFDASTSETSKSDVDRESWAGLGRSGTVAGNNTLVRQWRLTESGPFFGGGDPRHADQNQLLIASPQAWGGAVSNYPEIQSLISNFNAQYPAVDANGDGIADGHGLFFVNADGQGSFTSASLLDGFVNQALFEESLDSIRVEGEYSFDDGAITTVSGGIIYTTREKSKDNNGFFVTNTALPSATNPAGALKVSDYYVGQTDLSYAGLGSIAAYDVDAVYDSGFYLQTDAALAEPDRLGDTYTLEEDVTTLFAKVDFNRDLGGINVFGNVGLQVIDTDQKSFGFNSFTGPGGVVVATPTSGGASYTKTLPSLNLNFALDDQHMIRVAASKTISRARFDDLKPGSLVEYEFNIVRALETQDPAKGPWTGRTGNAELEPYESNNFEVSYENYFADEGIFAITAFYKDLVNWHRAGAEVADFSEFYIPEFHRIPDSTGTFFAPRLLTGISNTREDGLEGSVNGIEVSVNLPLSVLHDSLEGFGISASYAHSDGQLDGVDGAEDGRVPGLSEDVWSLTGYYQNGGFEARLSVTDRSEFESEIRGGSNSIDPVDRLAAQLIDAQISYDFVDSSIDWLQGLRVSLQAQNLGDEDDTLLEQDATSPLLVTSNQQYGRNYLLNLNYSFY